MLALITLVAKAKPCLLDVLCLCCLCESLKDVLLPNAVGFMELVNTAASFTLSRSRLCIEGDIIQNCQ